MNEQITARRVLITGAAGAIGSVLRKGFQGRYDLLRLSDIEPLGAAGRGEELVQADILDLDATVETMKGIDCVVHLAGMPIEDDWQTILKTNIIGCYNVFEAARLTGVKRVVFASSNHVIGFHRRERPIDTEVMVRPDSRYGMSKAYGEALGRLYADKYGISVSCLRIGAFREAPEDVRQLMIWISHRDMVHLVERCVDHPVYHFAIIYGVSNNDQNIWDNSKVDWLGYRPMDNAEDYAEAILSSGASEDPVAKMFHGGSFCSAEFSGDLDRIS